MTRPSLLCAAVLLLCCTAADKKDAAPPDAERIQGTWSFVSNTVNGHAEPHPENHRVVIRAGAMTVGPATAGPREGVTFRYTIDPTKSPKLMDWSAEVDAGRPIRQPAIYLLDGDTLKIAHAAAGRPRPADFVSRAGDSGGVWVLRRDPAPAAKRAEK